MRPYPHINRFTRPLSHRLVTMIERGYTFDQMWLRSSKAYSGPWFNQLLLSTDPNRYRQGGRRPAPSRDAVPGLAAMMLVDETIVMRWIEQEWYGRDQSGMSARVHRIATLIDALPEDEATALALLLSRRIGDEHGVKRAAGVSA
jgi:hypothetical protein